MEPERPSEQPATGNAAAGRVNDLLEGRGNEVYLEICKGLGWPRDEALFRGPDLRQIDPDLGADGPNPSSHGNRVAAATQDMHTESPMTKVVACVLGAASPSLGSSGTSLASRIGWLGSANIQPETSGLSLPMRPSPCYDNRMIAKDSDDRYSPAETQRRMESAIRRA
jgi:hypothetical protein